MTYQSSKRLFAIFRKAKPPRMTRQIINKVERTNSLTLSLAPNPYDLNKQVSCQHPSPRPLPLPTGRQAPGRGEGEGAHVNSQNAFV
jgi:hypothetical protein